MPIMKVSEAIDPKAILTKERIVKLVKKVKEEILQEILESDKTLTIDFETLESEYIKSSSDDIKVEPPKKTTKIKFGESVKDK